MEEYAQRVLELVGRIPSGRVVAYGDIAKALRVGGARNVGTVMSRYGSDVPWWRVIRSDGRPPQGLDTEAVEHWRAEGTPMVRGLLEGGRADMSLARWPIPPSAGSDGARGGLHHIELWVEDIAAAGREWLAARAPRLPPRRRLGARAGVGGWGRSTSSSRRARTCSRVRMNAAAPG